MFLNNFIPRSNKQDVDSKSTSINSFLGDLKNHLFKPSNTIYTIDRIEGSFAVCENMKTLKIENILLTTLPHDIKEGTVLKFENGIYFIDDEYKKIREKQILDKVNKVWKDQDKKQ